MAHLLEEYAKSLGVKTSNPVVVDHFFPLGIDKYITLANNDNVESKNYPYYHVVLNLLKPFLERANIQVVQLGGKTRIEGVDAALNLSFKQQAFVLSNSLVHIGSDGALSHLASAKKIPTVNIFGNTFPKANRPLFSSPSLNINLSPKWDKKPCFGPVDPKKQIRNIKAEVIAQSVLDLLKIEKETIKFSTQYVGACFSQNSVEVVPTSFVKLNMPQDQLLAVRADYGFDEAAFLQYCQTHKVSVCAKNLIQPHGLQQIAANVHSLFIFVDPSWDEIPTSYFKVIKNFGIELVFLVEKEEDLPVIRNKYFDIPVRFFESTKKAPCRVKENSRFISSKRLIEGGKEYLSYGHWKKGLDINNKVLDTPEYWRDLDHFYIYEQD